MNINVIKFFEKYNSDPELYKRIQDAVAAYPGSLELREALVEAVLLPVAEEMGLPFTVVDLKVYEATKRNAKHKNVELTEEDLAEPDDDEDYWLEGKGWSNDESVFCPGHDK